MSEKQGPFVLQGYDSFEREYYNIWPIEEHTHETYEQAMADAEVEWQKIQADQPPEDDEDDEDDELQDELYIVDLNGNRHPYP